MNGLIGRVTHMENCMKRVEAAHRRGELHAVSKQIAALRAYMDSGQWLRDYESDERGEIPKDMPRGVLSQDALYDLLREIDEK